MRFNEYCSHIHTQHTPKVQFGISSVEETTESSKEYHYDDYIGHEKELPENNGYKRVYKGLYTHPEHPGKTFYFNGENTPKVFNDDDDAMAAVDNDRRQKLKHLSVIGNSLERHYHPRKYTEDDKKAIASYTHYTSDLNNKILKNNLSDEHHEAIKKLDTAIHREHTPHEMVVYSGTNADHAELIHKNDVIHHPSYISSSISMNKALNFARDKGGDIVKIHLPAEFPSVYAGSMSQIPREMEVVLPRNLKLKIDHSKRQTMSYDLAKRPVYIHHAYPVIE
jgi:hypothetical protein